MTRDQVLQKHGGDARIWDLVQRIKRNRSVYDETSDVVRTPLNLPRIIQNCVPNPLHPSTSVVEDLVQEIRRTMNGCSETTELVALSWRPEGRAVDVAIETLRRSFLEKNTNIGVISSVSIASPITQCCLNT